MTGSALNPLGPVAGAYCLHNGECDVIMGPVGSAKTTGSMLRIARHAWEQQPWEGVARTRFAIVRNTGPQLTDTTMKSWFKLFPTDNKWRRYTSTTKTATWKFPIKPGVFLHSEFLFRALDDEDDVANLLSLEVTGFYFNEFREISTDIFANARARYGRYPGADMGGCTWQGAIGDTNPWAFTSDFHDMFVVNKRPNFEFFHQPGGLDPDAENLENLNQNQESVKLPLDSPVRRDLGRQYYIRLLDTYKKHEADMYVHSKYGVSRSGQPVFPSYDDNAHCKLFELAKEKDGRVPLKIGYDNTGRNPAALIAQRTANGQWRARYEFVGEGIGMKAHAAALRAFLAEKVPNYRIDRITCDPAGEAKGADELSMRMVIQREFPGVMVVNARTNDIETRIDAGESVFRRMVNGDPAILIHPDCKTLRAALTHKYQYRKLKLSGEERFTEVPDKIAPYADIADALQYLLLGGGEGRVNSEGGSAEMWGKGKAITPWQPTTDRRRTRSVGTAARLFRGAPTQGRSSILARAAFLMSELSLLDTEGMKVREWFVTYHDRPPGQHWVFRWLKRGYRHVELARELRYGPGVSDTGWLLLLPTVEMLEVEACADPQPPWVRCPEATVQKVTAMRPLWSMRSWFDVGPTTCVEAAKWALGIRAFWVRTPWQLFNYIRKRNGVVINGRRRR